MEVAPGTIVVWSDTACPWSVLTVWRLRAARDKLGVEVVIDHRAFPLELFNDRPTPRHHYDPEIAAAATVEPDAGWHPWDTWDSHYPVTILPAMEAVQAAKEQGLAAAEELDFGLRQAMYEKSMCISMRHVILDVARDCKGVDPKALAAALDEGRARRRVIEDWQQAKRSGVNGSPHLFLPDGTNVVNPGVRMHFEREPSPARCVIDENDPSVFSSIVLRSAASRP